MIAWVKDQNLQNPELKNSNIKTCSVHTKKRNFKCNRPGRVAQSVTCLATDASLTADPGFASSILARSHTFVEIDYDIISTVFSYLPLNHSRRIVVSYKRKYVHKVLVNCLFKLAQEKKCG